MYNFNEVYQYTTHLIVIVLWCCIEVFVGRVINVSHQTH